MPALSIKNRHLLTIAFILIIYSVPAFWLLRWNHQQTASMIEGRNLKTFSLEKLGLRTALESWQNGDRTAGVQMVLNILQNCAIPKRLEDAASDQFPLRSGIIALLNRIGRSVINLVYLNAPEPAIPATLQPDNEIYLMRDRSGFIYKPAAFTPITVENISARIANYAELIALYPDLNFHVFNIESIWNSAANPLDPYVQSPDRGQAYAYFAENKPSALHLARFALPTYQDYLKYYYRTDGHWNIHGILAAYESIHTLLSESYPQISPVHRYNTFITFPDIAFIGQHGRRSIYPIVGEPFEVVDYALGPYKVFKDGEEFTYGKSADYFAGQYSTEPYVHHYGEFFGWNEAFLEFVFENGSSRNILIFGDSYDNPLLPLIASHYYHTYSIDLRSYPDFSLGEFTAAHPVDDVLVIGINSVAFESTDGLIQP